MNKMRKHEMHLDPGPFEMIKSGRKKYELRLYDEKRRAVKPGDAIEFTNNSTGEKLLTEVLSLHVFPDAEALLAALPPEDCGWPDAASASPRDMEEYYPPERIRRFGLAAIELKKRTDRG